MVGFPRSWRGLVHAQAARPSRSQLAYYPGWQGTGQQPIRRVPVASYTSKVSGVPLNGGQAQGVIPGYAGAQGSLTSPAAFATVTFTQVPSAGKITVAWSVTLAGTVSAGDANNFQLYSSSTLLAQSVNAAAAGTYVQAPVSVNATAGEFLSVVAGPGAGTAGSVYTGAIASGGGALTLAVGPSGLGTVWYASQVTMSTSTGLAGGIDTSVAQVYLGPAITPTSLVGSVFGGNGTAALAIPPLMPGQTLICQWTNARPGDTAAFNVIGTQDALSTQ